MQLRALFSMLITAALLAGAAEAQTPASGSLLVATGELTDRNFAESVLLIIHHGEDGTLGILINRPTSLRPAAVFADIPAIEGYDGTLFLGGPVGPNQLLMLLRAPPAGMLDGPPVVGDVYVSADPAGLDALGEAPADASRVRLYAGHAAWGPGQLETEIGAGAWRVVAGRAEWVFAAEPLDLWRQLARERAELIVDSSRR